MLFKYGVYRLKIHYRSKVVFVQSFSYLTTKNDRPIFLSNTVEKYNTKKYTTSKVV